MVFCLHKHKWNVGPKDKKNFVLLKLCIFDSGLVTGKKDKLVFILKIYLVRQMSIL